MSALPYEIILLFEDRNTVEGDNLSIRYNYAPSLPITWKQLRKERGKSFLAYKLLVPELWRQISLSEIERNSILVAIQNLVVDEFYEWCMEQVRKKTAFLPSIRVGGKFQSTLTTFLHSISGELASNSCLPDFISCENRFEQEGINMSGVMSTRVHYSKVIATLYNDESISFGAGPLSVDNHFHYQHFPKASFPLNIADNRLSNESECIQHENPSFQKKLSEFGVRFNSSGGKSQLDGVLLSDVASMQSRISDDFPSILTTPSPFDSTELNSSKLFDNFRTSLIDKRRSKHMAINTAKLSTDEKNIKEVHRQANEIIDILSIAEQTQFLPIVHFVTVPPSHVTQGAQSLFSRSDSVVLTREELLENMDDCSQDLQRSKGNCALFPKSLSRSAPIYSDGKSICENRFPDTLLDLAPLWTTLPHRINSNECGLGLLGSTNSGDEKSRLCRETQCNYHLAMNLLLSQRFHTSLQSDNVNRAELIRASVSSLRIRRPLLASSSPRPGDRSAISSYNAGLLFGAHSPSVYDMTTRTHWYPSLDCLDSNVFRVFHDRFSTEASVSTSSYDGLTPSPELCNLILSQAKDKFLSLQEVSTLLLGESMSSSANIALGVIFEEVVDSMFRFWRQRCGDGLVADFIAALTENDVLGTTKLCHQSYALRSQCTHALWMPSVAGLPQRENMDSSPNKEDVSILRRISPLSRAADARAAKSSKRRSTKQFLRSQKKQIHQRNGRCDNHLRHERRYFELDKRSVRRMRQLSTSSTAVPCRQGLRIFPVGLHRYFLRTASVHAAKRKRHQRKVIDINDFDQIRISSVGSKVERDNVVVNSAHSKSNITSRSDFSIRHVHSPVSSASLSLVRR